jgi:hypothetical protein
VRARSDPSRGRTGRTPCRRGRSLAPESWPRRKRPGAPGHTRT